MRHLFLVLAGVFYSVVSFAQSEVSLSIPVPLEDTICRNEAHSFRLRITNNDSLVVGYFPIRFDLVDKDGDTVNVYDTIFGYIDSFSYINYQKDFKPLKNGIYHVTGYIQVWDDTVRANDTVRFSFFVKPIPEAFIPLRDVYICKGDSVSLEIKTNYSNVEWYATDKPGRPPVYVGKIYKYLPTGTSTSTEKIWKLRINIQNFSPGMRCDYNDTITVHVISQPRNELTKTGDTLIAGDGENYQWYLDDAPIFGANSKIYIPKKTGNYYVRYTVPAPHPIACSGKSTSLFVTVVDTSSSLTEWAGNAGILVYPNPGDGLFHLNWDGPAPDEIMVLNTIGQTVLAVKDPVCHTVYTVDIKGAKDGLYFIVVKSGRKFYRFKVNKI
jgi:hypothetical protein